MKKPPNYRTSNTPRIKALILGTWSCIRRHTRPARDLQLSQSGSNRTLEQLFATRQRGFFHFPATAPRPAQTAQKLVGTTIDADHSPDGPFFLREGTQSNSFHRSVFTTETAIKATTLEEARAAARERVARLILQGWVCKAVTPPASASTTHWVCKKQRGVTKWVSVHHGTAKPQAPTRWTGMEPDAYSVDKLIEMMTEWNCYPGFSGQRCSRCLVLVNVFAGGPGWFCACSHYNCQSWSHHQFPHESPDYGPSLAALQEAYASTSPAIDRPWRRVRTTTSSGTCHAA